MLLFIMHRNNLTVRYGIEAKVSVSNKNKERFINEKDQESNEFVTDVCYVSGKRTISGG